MLLFVCLNSNVYKTLQKGNLLTVSFFINIEEWIIWRIINMLGAYFNNEMFNMNINNPFGGLWMQKGLESYSFSGISCQLPQPDLYQPIESCFLQNNMKDSDLNITIEEAGIFLRLPSLNFGFLNQHIHQKGINDFAPFLNGLTTVRASENNTNSFIMSNSKPVSSSSETSVSATQLKDKWVRFKGAGTLAHLPDRFFERVIEISEKIDCDPNDLMAIMNIETIGSFKANKRNRSTRATGLIQFMPTTAIGMGTTIDRLAQMTELEQLDYVEKHFIDGKKYRNVTGRVDAATLYALVFWPAAASKGNSYVIASRGQSVYSSNPLLDFDKDNKITKADLGNTVAKFRA